MNNYELRITNYELRITNYELRIYDFRVKVNQGLFHAPKRCLPDLNLYILYRKCKKCRGLAFAPIFLFSDTISKRKC